MAAIQGLYAEGIDTNVTDTTWVDIATISAGSFTAGAKYLIVANAIVRSTSGSDNSFVRLVHGTTPTEFTDGNLNAELTTGNVQEHCFSWMYVYTQPGTAELVKIQASSQTTSDIFVELGQIFAINLDQYGVNNTDYFFNEVTADYTTTATKTAQANVTFTPNGTDDWLIIGSFAQNPGSTADNYLADLNDSVAGVLTSLDIEGEDLTTLEIRGHNLMAVVTPTNASHTFSVRFSHETTAGTILSSRIFAINLNKFRQHSFVTAAAEDTPAASPSWQTTSTIAPTPSATGDWFIWGTYINDVGSFTTEDIGTRLQINASGGGLASNPNYGDSAPGTDGWDNTDEIPFHIFKMVALSSGASRTINLDIQAVAGTAMRAQNRTLVAFPLDTAATVIDKTFTASASFQATINTNFTASASFQGTVNTPFTAGASFATLINNNFTASSSFATLIDKTFTASASFQKWEAAWTARSSFQGTIDISFSASASFRNPASVYNFFTAAASFAMNSTSGYANPIYYPYPESYESHYEIRLATPDGKYIDILDSYTNLDYTLVTNDVGACIIELPSTYPINNFRKDSRIEIWRAVGFGGFKLEGDTQFLVQGRERSVSENGQRTIKITALSLNHILKRRIVAYRGDQLTYVDIADNADDIMKLVMRTNFGSSAVDTDRIVSSTYFSVDSDKGQGQTVYKTFPHKNILDLMKELADSSYDGGVPVFFDIVVDTPPISHIFKTWKTARGRDRRYGHQDSNLVLGFNQGSIGAYTITEDWSNEISYVYAAGPGEEDVRDVQPAYDPVLIAESPYGRSELWIDSQDSNTSNTLLSEAGAALTANRSKKFFVARLINTPQATYGVHWGWGDYVTADAENEQFDCFVSSVHVQVAGPEGKENIDAGLRND